MFRQVLPINPPAKAILIPEIVFWLMVLAGFGAGSDRMHRDLPGFAARRRAVVVGLVGLWDGVCYAFRWTSLHVGEQASAGLLARNLRV